MNGSKLAPEAARIALLDRINYSQSALQKAYDSHKILLEQLNEISDELTMPDKILLEVEEYLEPEYTRATRIENIKLWLTVALGVSSLCLTINHIAAIYYTGVILFVVALILGIVLLVVSTALRKGNIQQRKAWLNKLLSIIVAILFFAICAASILLYYFNEDTYFTIRPEIYGVIATRPRNRRQTFPEWGEKPCPPPQPAAVLHRSRPILRPSLPAPRPAILFPTATNCPSFPRAHKRAHKKRTAGVTPAVLSIYRRTAAPSLRTGLTPRPSLPWQPSWRSSPRQPPWRSSARPDLRCRPASSSRPKR